MGHTTIRLLAAALAALLAASQAFADDPPEAGHVRLEASALRLQVNDYSTRWQFKLHVNVTAPEEGELAGVETAVLTLRNPEGRYVELLPRQSEIFPKRFKAANARLQFRALEDSAAPGQGNLPAGFFSGGGPYRFSLQLQRDYYSGEFGFGDELAMQALQPGASGALEAVRNFCMASEQPLHIATQPSGFGPVYYKRQDLKNFVFQLANIDDSLTSGSYHAPVENPQYIFQVRVGDAGGAMQLLDPSRYIRGHQPFLIRSDWTETPLQFQPADLAGHKAVLIDFIRTDTQEPDAGLTGPTRTGRGWSGQIEVQQRVMYALYIDLPPAPGELLQQAGQAAVEEETEVKAPRGWR